MSYEPTTAVRNAPSRKVFSSLFRARWQNMQNIINDSAFVDMIPEPYLSYYLAYIRQWLQWSTGFVPMLHRQDFFSTGMGYTVCDIFTRECMSGGYRLTSSDGKVKDFVESWADSNDLASVLNKMFFFANAGGNAILCLTPIAGKLYPSVLPVNRLIFQIGRRGEITDALILNRFTAGQTAFYAKERRILFKGKAYWKVTLGRGTIVTSPSWGTEKITEVPAQISSQWEYAYGHIKPGVWYEFPLRSVGLYNVRNKSVAVAIDDLPGYSDSSLHTALDILYSIDYNYTQQQVDQYMGKSRALVPKQMQTVQAVTGVQAQVLVQNGRSFVESVTEPQLNDEFYTEVAASGTNGEPIKPYFIQPDLRGEAHKYLRDADLELLASKVGLSSSTLANHLSYNNSKTATEVRAEQDTTEISVNNKRSLANKAINAMLSDLAAFEGYTENVEINWGRAGVNTSTENAELLADYQAGTISLKDYMHKRWPDLSEEAVDAKSAELEQKAKENAFGGKMYNDADYFGEELHHAAGGQGTE